VASCGACANEEISEEEDREAAHVDLRGRGWTQGVETLCPRCSASFAEFKRRKAADKTGATG
jgi:hypothetical protein